MPAVFLNCRTSGSVVSVQTAICSSEKPKRFASRTVSFAVFFYGRRDVEVLHSYKFRGDPTRLDRPGPRPLYVIAPRSQVQRLLRDHPGLVPVQELGPLAMFRRDAAR